MRIEVITLFPDLIANLQSFGVVGKAIANKTIDLHSINPREFSDNKHRTVDDRPYGGGPGMVMTAPPLLAAIRSAKAHSDAPSHVICMSPQGQTLKQNDLQHLKTVQHLIVIAGRYEGIDERVMDLEVDSEWSIGDFVVSGGELPAMLLIDGLARLLPGVLGHEESAEQDSFSTGILDCPHYSRPETVEQRSVPTVLLSGDHEKIKIWRRKQALGRTWERRPDLLDSITLSSTEQRLLEEFKNEHATQDLKWHRNGKNTTK